MRSRCWFKNLSMSDTNDERIRDLTTKVNDLILGYRIAAFALILLFSFISLGNALSINKFQRIYMDALGLDHPLPGLTLLFIGHQSFVTFLAFLWAVLGFFAVLKLKRIFHSVNRQYRLVNHYLDPTDCQLARPVFADDLDYDWDVGCTLICIFDPGIYESFQDLFHTNRHGLSAHSPA